MRDAYIDIRPTWPTYIKGLLTVTLKGADRSITVERAEEYITVHNLLDK